MIAMRGSFLIGVVSLFLAVNSLVFDEVNIPSSSVNSATTGITPTFPKISATVTALAQVDSYMTPDTASYEKIASEAIQASNNALEQMKWVVATVVPILILVAGGVVSYFVKAQKDLLDYADRARKELNEAGQKLIAAEKQSNSISSTYLHLLTELNHQSVIFLPPEMAIAAFEQGKITKDEFRESQIWLAWANWFYLDKEEGYFQLEVHKESIQSLPDSIRRIMIVEVERIKSAVDKRGMIYRKEKEVLGKLLKLLDLEIIDRKFFSNM